MRDFRHLTYRLGLEALYFSGAYRALRPVSAGLGIIFTLHNVRPEPVRGFSPNALLDITPRFLETVLQRVRAAGYDLVSLDEVHARLTGQSEASRPFVAFTFDDGYRNNPDYAFPLMRRHGAPYALFVTTKFADQTGMLWWSVLEKGIRDNSRVTALIDGKEQSFDCSDNEAKYRAFDTIYWWMRSLSESELQQFVKDFGARTGVDPDALCASQCLDWDGIRAVASDPLATIGGHSVNHFRLRKDALRVARNEVEHCREVIEAEIGRRVEHFCYPVGDATSAGPEEFAMVKSLGFKTAVTTRPGMVFSDHRDHLTALPRVSLNGLFQNSRYLDVLLSGAPFALKSQFRRVDAA